MPLFWCDLSATKSLAAVGLECLDTLGSIPRLLLPAWQVCGCNFYCGFLDGCDAALKLRERVDLHFTNCGPVSNVSPGLVAPPHCRGSISFDLVYLRQECIFLRGRSGGLERPWLPSKGHPPPQLLGGWFRKANFRLGGAGHTPWFPPWVEISSQLPDLLPWLRRELGSQHTLQGPRTFQSPGHSWPVCSGARTHTDRTLTSTRLLRAPLLAKSVMTKNS